jgi:hypothetical protein
MAQLLHLIMIITVTNACNRFEIPSVPEGRHRASITLYLIIEYLERELLVRLLVGKTTNPAYGCVRVCFAMLTYKWGGNHVYSLGQR